MSSLSLQALRAMRGDSAHNRKIAKELCKIDRRTREPVSGKPQITLTGSGIATAPKFATHLIRRRHR